ncbi:major facilitator superfamily transporter [Fusarium oxysporum]|nr:major facilitator superfamily transporter [Fusarium oxysporum]
MAENKASIDIERPASQRTLTPSYTGSAAKKDEESPATKEDVAQPEDPNAVDWDGPDDPNNPMNWPARKKWTCIGALSVMTLLTYGSSMFAPGVPDIMREFETSNRNIATFVVSVYVLGFAFGPLLAAPLSEIYGRAIVFNIANVLFLIMTVATALSQNMPMLIVFRFLMGFTGSTPVTNGSGTISDIFPVQERGKAMAVWAMGPLLGPCIGPLAGGYMVEAIGWRWVFWLIAILVSPISLRVYLKKETGNQDLYSILDKDGLTPKQRLSNASIRPMRMLFTHLPVFILSLYVAIVYGVLYLMFSTFTFVFAQQYGFGTGTIGLAYLPTGIGMLLGTMTFGVMTDVVIKKKIEQNGKTVPEDRLPIWMTLPSGLLIVGALFWYGWAADQNVHWIVPMIGVALFCFGLMGIMMCLQTYLVDAYITYAASAVAAMTVLRSLAGAMLPLAGLSMYDDLGLGWGNSILAFLALALVPVPVIFFLYGPKIRAKSPNNLDHTSHRSSDVEAAPKEEREKVSNTDILRESWSKKALIVAFTGLFATTFITQFLKYATKVYDAYATSAFQRHSALATANVVSTIIGLVTYPIMAKFSNVFGRAEGLTFSILFLVLSQVMYAACQNIATYIAGGIFESIGDTGYVIMQQVFIADTTSLINRGLWTSLPESFASIPTLYLGSIVADSVLKHSTWRWGYGMWALILPFCAAPLIITLYVLQRRARKAGYRRKGAWDAADKTQPLSKRIINLIWVDLDILGAVLLVLGLGLTLIPLSLTGARNSDRWDQGSYIAMLVIGVVVVGVFFVWDTKFAKVPFVPFRMIKERTVVAACVLSMLDFFHYSCFTLFFPSYLQVAGGFSPGHATRIDNALRVAFQIASVLVGVLMKYTKRSQIFVFIGVPLCVLGQGLMIHFVNMNGGHANEASFITAKTLVGVGRAFYQTAAQVSIQALVAKEDVPVVTGVYYAAMNFGGAVGTSVGGAIWNNILPQKLTKYLPEQAKPNAFKIYKSIVVAQKFAKGTPVRAAIDQAYRETQRLLAIAATCSLAPMLIVMFALKAVDLTKVDEAKIEENKSTDGEVEPAVMRENVQVKN